MNEPQKIKLECTDQQGNKLVLEMPWDADAEAVVHNFKVIMLFLTFTEDTIKECFVSEE